MKEIYLQYILGDLDVPFILAFYTFAMMGMAIDMFLEYRYIQRRSNACKKASKKESKFKCFMKKASGVMLELILVFVILRFYDELPEKIKPGNELGMFTALLIGAGMDRLILLIRKYLKSKYGR